MKYYLVTDADGQSLRRVSEAEGAPTLEQLGIDPATAIEVPRPPREHESWDAAAGAWALDCAACDAELHARIDREAGEFRRRFITCIPGQELTYIDKEREALRFAALDDPDADPAGFPLLAPEAAARGMALADMVAMVIAKATALRALNGRVEAARVGAKEAVTAAATQAAKHAAAAVDWDALIDPAKPEKPASGQGA